MAPVIPSFILQGRTDNTAQAMRMALAADVIGAMVVGATAPGGGVHPAFGNRLNVTGTSGMTVNVDTGLVYMPASTAWNGIYAGWNIASYSVAVPAASATQYRQDYIAAVQTDTGSSTDVWDIVNVAGTFSASAPGALPTLPNNAVPLAIVAVTPNMTVTNGVGTVQDARVWAPLSSTIPCTSSTRPPLTCPEGTEFFESDTHMMGMIVNGAYQYEYNIPGGAALIDTWHDFGALSNSWTVNGTNPLSGYRRAPFDPSIMQIIVNFHSGVITNGTVIVNLPSPYRVSANYQRIDLSCDIESAGWTSPRADGGSPYLRFSTTGDISVWGLPNGAGSVYTELSQVRLT
jgi:hypothetical protein